MQSRFAHELCVWVGLGVSVRVCVATFSGMTPLLGLPLPAHTLLQFELRLHLPRQLCLLSKCRSVECVYHMLVPLIRSTGPRSSCLQLSPASCLVTRLPACLPASSLVLVLNLLPFCNFFRCHFLLFSFFSLAPPLPLS